MAESFDPYLHWLGIRDSQRPPHHYRLLGVAPFESDPDVLLNAADRQMAHVRMFQSGKHSADSQRILNELAMAKLCLLNAEKKAAYDARLRVVLAEHEAPVPPPPSLEPPPLMQPSLAGQSPIVSPELLDEVTAATSDKVFAPLDSSPKLLRPILAVGGVVLIVLVVIHLATMPKKPSMPAPPPVPTVSKSAPEEEPEPPPKPPQLPPPKPAPLVPESPPNESPQPAATVPESPEPPKVARRDVPSADAQAASLREIRELFQNDYAKAQNSEQRRVLAEMLMRQAIETQDDPPARFVLYTEACDMAAQAGDGRLLGALFTMVSQEYSLDEEVLAEETLVKAAKKARDVAANEALGRCAFERAKTAVGAGQFDRARHLADAARDMARKARDAATIRQAAALNKDVEHRERLQAAFADTEKRLAIDPNDSAANLTAAGYYCLVKDDWLRGLPLALKSSDTAIRAAAEADIAEAPSAPGEMTALGDRWFEAIKGSDDNGRLLARVRAAYWYQLAQPKTAGLTRSKIDRRLLELSE